MSPYDYWAKLTLKKMGEFASNVILECDNLENALDVRRENYWLSKYFSGKARRHLKRFINKDMDKIVTANEAKALYHKLQKSLYWEKESEEVLRLWINLAKTKGEIEDLWTEIQDTPELLVVYEEDMIKKLAEFYKD